MGSIRVGGWFAVFAAAAGIGCPAFAQQTSWPPPAEADWTDHWGGDKGQAFSLLAEITTANVGRLGLAWSLDLPDEHRGLEATPVVINGVIYFTGSASRVHAVDAISGRMLWTFDPRVWEDPRDSMQFNHAVNRGPAYAFGKVYVGTIDGRLIALDAKTGKLVWSANTAKGDTSGGSPLMGQPEAQVTITGSPLVFRDKVMIGQGGGDQGIRGYVSAYDARSGKLAWRFYVAPGSPEENANDPTMAFAAKTWSGEYWKTGTGGGPWHGLTYDPEFNQVYIGTGNGGPWNVNARSPGDGDNLFLASIVALDADTGRYRWHYQVNPRESWDFKATSNMTLATIEIDGKPRKVLMQAPTNGFFYVLDRETGKLVNEPRKIGKVTWATRIDLKTGRPLEAPGIRFENGPVSFWPSPWGVHNWQTMSYSPRTGLAYIPTMQAGMRYAPLAGSGWLDLKLGIEDPDEGKGWLLAWDPVKQKEKWRVKHDTLYNGGTMVTAGGLVFRGTAGGLFAAYDADSGERLWSFNAGVGVMAAPVTYAAGSHQQISILAGYGGGVEARFANALGWKYGVHPRRLLTFKLDGAARLPPTPGPDFSFNPVDDPGLVIDEAQAKDGGAIYGLRCAMCHGGGVKASGGNGPDLRESGVALDPAAFRAVVKEGSLRSRGMPRFSQISDADVQKLYLYVRAEARRAVMTRGEAIQHRSPGMR